MFPEQHCPSVNRLNPAAQLLMMAELNLAAQLQVLLSADFQQQFQHHPPAEAVSPAADAVTVVNIEKNKENKKTPGIGVFLLLSNFTAV